MATHGSSLRRADRLRVVRRADWRFLLALPSPRRVLWLGEHDAALVASLREISVEVEAAASGRTEPCDLLVAVQPTPQELARAPELLRPGGWIYVETRGLVWPRQRPGAVRGVSACTRALRRLGFEGVAAHWHFPGFASCLEIVPLADRRAVGLALRRRQRTPATQAQVVAARLALALGIFPHVVPEASVIASSPAGPSLSPSR